MIPTWRPVQKKLDICNCGFGITQKANVAEIRFLDDTLGQTRCPEIWFHIRTGSISHEPINQTRARCFVGGATSHFICLPFSEEAGSSDRGGRGGGEGRRNGGATGAMLPFKLRWRVCIPNDLHSRQRHCLISVTARGRYKNYNNNEKAHK